MINESVFLRTNGIPSTVLNSVDHGLEFAPSVLILVVTPVIAIGHPGLVHATEEHPLAIVVEMVPLDI